MASDSSRSLDHLRDAVGRTANTTLSHLRTARTLAGAGVVRPVPPGRVPAMLRTALKYGVSPVTGWVLSAQRDPDHIAVIDDAGTYTYGELHERTNALARALTQRGFRAGDGLAVMCRNHRGCAEVLVTAGKLGARLLLINTEFAEPQLRDVLEREKASFIICDDEFSELVSAAAPAMPQYVSWHDGQTTRTTVDDLVAGGDTSDVAAPAEHVRFVILTSGTTGTPKGAQRAGTGSLETAAGFLSMIPIRAGETSMILPPLFHAWGFLHMGVQLALAGTMVLRRKFDAEQVLADLDEHRPEVMVVVPVILRRVVDAAHESTTTTAPNLRIIATSGSALPGELAIATMDRFGDVLYNLYGSTEVTAATIATPAELRRSSGTAGRPLPGTEVVLLDADGRAVHGTGPEATGRIFVGAANLFDGYTGGGTKESIDGRMSTGDVGYFDEHGCLHVSGRADDMIVSGGENVFPREVEDIISDHPSVREAAVIGVADDEFGQRLRAFVVASGEVTEADVKDLVRSHLARFKVPREVIFLDELPRTPTGKVLRRSLRDYEAPGPPD